jgi:hypothetical protein
LLLLTGESLKVERTSFQVGWKDLNLNINKSTIIIKGIVGKVKNISNTQDTNFKFISFNVKYEIILHPLHYLNTDRKEIKIKDNSSVYLPPYSLLPRGKDAIINMPLFSNLNIFIFIFVLILFLLYFLWKINWI